MGSRFVLRANLLALYKTEDDIKIEGNDIEEVVYNGSPVGVKIISESDKDVVWISDCSVVLEDNTRIAVEVKSRISPDDDILRGIYQCIKYKAVMDAENRIHGNPFKTRTILVIEGKLSESNQQIMKSLGVEVIQEFKYEPPHTKVK